MRDCGNKYYQDTQSLEDYERKCQEEDPDGFHLIFGENLESDVELKVKFIPDVSCDPILDLDKYKTIKEHERTETEYIQDDVIRKYQIDYDESTCMVEKYPEAMQIEGVIGQSSDNQLHVIAPGEGKIPTNLTYCQDWDAKAFPMLHPDGKNHLSDDRRQRKLADVDYFKQRLFNKDSRWRRNPHWVFAAAVFKEKKDLQRNIDLAYKKGKKSTSRSGQSVYSLDDPFSVFQSVANTPAYHKKGKMEMFARLDNHGPFQVFYTISCADTRWKENVVSLLHEYGKSIRCMISDKDIERYEVLSTSDKWIPIEEYLATEMDQSLHEILRRNVVTATRIYQSRVQALMQEVVRHPSNPLSVKHFASKLEFQARGAGHNHGVLWLDIDKLEQKLDIRYFKPEHNTINEHPLMDSKDSKHLDDFLEEMGLKLDKPKVKKRVHKAFRYLVRLEKISQKKLLNEIHKKHLEQLHQIFPLYGLKSVLTKLQKNEYVTDDELDIVVLFVDYFATVSLHPAIVGSIVAAIAEKVNQHCHTHTCKKYKTICRFKMPKLPSYETLIARPPDKNLSEKEKNELEEKNAEIFKKVREVLDDKESMKTILEKYPKLMESNKIEAKQGRLFRINAVLDKAGFISDEDKKCYYEALSYSSSGYAVVMARDIDELMVNSYNPEITLLWDGNTDFQFCFDFYAIITYITEYFTKDDTGVTKTMVDAIKEANCEELKDKMKILMNTWIKNRQMGEAEAVYRLTREYHFRDSDTKCVFVQTCPKSERSKMLKNVTDKPAYANIQRVSVENHTEGEYIEMYDVNSKYDRRDRSSHPELEKLSFSHMSKMYSPWWGNQEKDEGTVSDQEVDTVVEERNMEADLSVDLSGKDESEFFDLNVNYGLDTGDLNKEEGLCFDEKFKFVMRYPLDEGEGEPLPRMFKLMDPYPGEPPYMKLRSKPAVLRFHKYKVERDPDAYWYSEALLYLPHRNDEDLLEQLTHAKENIDGSWDLFVTKIAHVKSQVMEYLEDNEEARLMAEEMLINNNLTGELLDPEGEQIKADDKLEYIEQLEDFQHIDIDFAEDKQINVFEEQFRPIEVKPLEILREDARKMDFYQRKILEIGVSHARAIVKARGGKNPPPNKSPLIMIDGAAGSGKSCTINILKSFLKVILQQPGDNPECPYILLCAPTGTAAVNINGQTLHTTFSFTWGDEHFSLSDKNRDTKRATFKNLKFLIIDEISMVKADQLYQIDLRLRELTMQPNKLFGGVSLFVFGDVMQLKPVKGVYIWQQPRNKEYLTAFLVQSHWGKFEVVSLVENHRQEGDAHYADVLNRIRVGEIKEEDLNFLQTRVRPENHPDIIEATVIASKHKVVNFYNRLLLQKIPSFLVLIEAVNWHNNIPNFVPKIDEKRGTVGTTAYVQKLHLKLECRVMMIDNIDVADCLCNGSLGTIKAILRDGKGQVHTLMISFDNEDSGREMRRMHPQLSKAFPGCTPIKKKITKYSTSRNSKGTRANTATVQQFPVIVSFASTTHKIQGQTIEAPRKAAIDLRTVFGANQAYVMLGRVQKQDQLYIIGDLPENKIYADKVALKELELLKARSMNRNPHPWEIQGTGNKIYFHNIQSLLDKLPDIKRDFIPFYADVIIFAETWLEKEIIEEDPNLQLKGYKLHLNSNGRGKGMAVYYKESTYSLLSKYKDPYLQISKLQSDDITIICLYRSYGDRSLASELGKIIPDSGNCLVIGDFNICSQQQPNHEVFSTLRTMQFRFITIGATHLKGGHIDQAWIRSINRNNTLVTYSPYYTCKDHDALLFMSANLRGKYNLRMPLIKRK